MTARKMFAPGEMKLEDSGALTAAFAQLGGVDADGDVTVHGACPTKDVVLSAYGHTSWDGALPVGKGSISEEGDWAIFKGDFFMDTTHGRDAFATVKGLGPLAEYSYGFNVLDDGPSDVKGATRELRSLDVFEVSPVLRGAGIGTHTLAIKSDAPGKDAPYAEFASWYLEHVPALIERTGDRVAFRAEKGRTLSTADRDRLESIADSYLAHADAIKAFLVDPAEAGQRARELMVEIARARANGVKT